MAAGIRRTRACRARTLSALHSFFYSIIERIPYIVLVKEARALRVVHANQSAARWLGRSTEALIGANVFDWRPEREAQEEARQDRRRRWPPERRSIFPKNR